MYKTLFGIAQSKQNKTTVIIIKRSSGLRKSRKSSQKWKFWKKGHV